MTAKFLIWFSIDQHPVRLLLLSVLLLAMLFGLTEWYLRWQDRRRAYLPELPMSKATQPRSFNSKAAKGLDENTRRQHLQMLTKTKSRDR